MNRTFWIMVVSLALTFGTGASAQAANRYWVSTIAGNWGDTSSWSALDPGVCGVGSGASVPGSDDVAIFEAGCATSATINTSVDVAGIDIQSGYTGTISQGSNTITVGSSHFSQANGTFSGGSATIDVNGNFTVSGGTFTSTSDTMSVSGNFSHSGGTFTHNSGTVALDGTSQTLTGATTFYNFTKTESANDSTDEALIFGASTTFTVANTLTLDGRDDNDRINLTSNSSGTQFIFDVTGGAASVDFLDVADSAASSNNITCTSCTNSGGNDDSEAVPHWIFAGTLDISGNVYSDEGSTALGSKTVRLAINGTDGSSATSNASTGAYSFTSVSISSSDIVTVYLEDESQDAVTVTVMGSSNLTGINLFQDRLITRCDNSCSLTNSNLSTAVVSSETDISNIYSVSSGNLTVASGKELFVPSSHTFVPGGTVTADDIDINGTLTLGSNATSIAGTWDATGGSFTTSGTVTFTSTGSEDIISNSNSFQNLTLNGSGGTFELEDTLDVNGNLTISAGTLDTKSGENNGITLAGNWDNSGSFTERTGTVTFDGTGAQTVSGETFYNLTINNSSGSPGDATDVDSSAAVTVSNTLTVTDGQFQPTTASDFSAVTIGTNGILKPDSGATVTVSGNWNNTGTFTANSGTVTFDGTSQDLNDDNTFYNLTKSVTAADTLTLEASATQTITNALTLQGVNELLLSLRSSASGTQWRINPSGTRTVQYVDVKDSNNTNTTPITCITGCVNSLNNTNWDFGATGGPSESGGGGGGGGGGEESAPTATPSASRATSKKKPDATPEIIAVLPPSTIASANKPDFSLPEDDIEIVSSETGEETIDVPAESAPMPDMILPAALDQKTILRAIADRIPTSPAITASVTGVAAMAAAASGGLISALPNAAANAWHLLQRLGQGIIGLAATRRRRAWGNVVDSTTGSPIPQAIVRVLDRQTQHIKDTAVTNEKGEFASLLGAGEYRFSVIKPGWTLTPMPGGYDGNIVSIQQEQLVATVIGMRPTIEVSRQHLRWKSWLQNLEVFLAAISWPLLLLGLGISVFALYRSVTGLNGVILGMYIILIAVKYWLGSRVQKTAGTVREGGSNRPIELALVQLYDAATARQVASKVTSASGQFVLLPTPGVYTVMVSKTGYGAYRESHLVIDRNQQAALATTFHLTPISPPV